MTNDTIEQISILGAGGMGHGIAAVTAFRQDRDPQFEGD
ncbi:hypothetical protein SAMN05216285_0115 [Natrinema salifodinae]|uniref:Uncharacterized protein n=1 Tax=Natrinema salifodinae TaxID=1202768 RepID=A0A1I0LXZ6_9EURY|nr:hypothetical protein SAMN05216285_0115 [Natrinema salifodinae]